MNKNIGCGASCALFILTICLHIAGLFFNGLFLQCVYNIGVCDVCTQFGVNLPEIGYFTFMMVWVIFTVFVMIFNGHELEKMIKENKNTDEDISGMFVKYIGLFINQILSKCIVLLTMWILHCLAF